MIVVIRRPPHNFVTSLISYRSSCSEGRRSDADFSNCVQSRRAADIARAAPTASREKSFSHHLMSAFRGKAGMTFCGANVRFSNRPFGVKRFQTIHLGIGAKALPSWGSKTRRNNLMGGLAVGARAGPSGHTISPHPSSREGHHSTTRWSSGSLLLSLIRRASYAAVTSRVQWNSVPSIQMRCMIRASRRARATIAFFTPPTPRDLHCPGLEPGPFCRAHQQDLGRFVKHCPHYLVPAA